MLLTIYLIIIPGSLALKAMSEEYVVGEPSATSKQQHLDAYARTLQRVSAKYEELKGIKWTRGSGIPQKLHDPLGCTYAIQELLPHIIAHNHLIRVPGKYSSRCRRPIITIFFPRIYSQRPHRHSHYEQCLYAISH